MRAAPFLMPCLYLTVPALASSGDTLPLIQVGQGLPPEWNLQTLDPETYLLKDSRDSTLVEKNQRLWESQIAPYLKMSRLRLRMGRGEHRIALLLGAAQALKARKPEIELYLSFEKDMESLWDEAAWGVLQGGIMTPEDLGENPQLWRTKLMQAQEKMPGRPWLLHFNQDPLAQSSLLLGDGGRIVIPAGGPSSHLAQKLQAHPFEIEGGLGDLTLRQGQHEIRFRFLNGLWQESELPKARNEVRVEAEAAYDMGALLARMRMAQLRDRLALKNAQARLDVDLHLQSPNSTGVDLGFTFQAFETLGESEELLQKELRFNGVKAKLNDHLQIPLVEARTSIAAPVALNLTERFRYADGGPSDLPHTRRVLFESVDGNPHLPSGELRVDEKTGRVLEERSQRSELPGMVKSEQRTFTYGEPAPGHWRIVEAITFERWVTAAGVGQVQRKLKYSDFKFNQDTFEQAREKARQNKGTMLKQTPEGLRYYNLENGKRVIEEKPKSSGRGFGGMLWIDPDSSIPVMPLGGFAYFDFNAFNKGIQLNFITAIVYNNFSMAIPHLPGGFDLSAHVSTMLLPSTERPVKNGQLLNQDGVSRQWGRSSLAIGRDLGLGFRLEGKAFLQYDRFGQSKEEDYKTPGFQLPPSGLTPEGRLELSWQRSGFELATYLGQGQRPKGSYGAPQALQLIPNNGRFQRWGGSLSYDYRLPVGAWLHGEVGHMGGRHFDRFNDLNLGGTVKGFSSYSVSSDQVNYAKLGLTLKSGPKLRLGATLDHARARSLDDQKVYGFTGLGISGDIPGFWIFTAVRMDLGVGLHSDIPDTKGVRGYITLLRVF